MLLWPSEDMDFWKIESDEDIVTVKWSHNYFEDYKILSYQFFECGNRTFGTPEGAKTGIRRRIRWSVAGETGSAGH